MSEDRTDILFEERNGIGARADGEEEQDYCGRGEGMAHGRWEVQNACHGGVGAGRGACFCEKEEVWWGGVADLAGAARP